MPARGKILQRRETHLRVPETVRELRDRVIPVLHMEVELRLLDVGNDGEIVEIPAGRVPFSASLPPRLRRDLVHVEDALGGVDEGRVEGDSGEGVPVGGEAVGVRGEGLHAEVVIGYRVLAEFLDRLEIVQGRPAGKSSPEKKKNNKQQKKNRGLCFRNKYY
ncbi:hypothetical protein H6P81_016999 [Aristolochia fimbriata]|uniref:Uncharacterized protein n=1 Tax=Aristolochia fimbriata TaxID=158543 RepID=A0AAV7DYX1_ARIFI|nr:hypothetical protein H6P81_016999 [Aristolochia fimbriata]